MSNKKRNRQGVKNTEKESRTGNITEQQTGYRKLPDNPSNRSDESISTVNDTSNGKYSRTGMRDDEINNEDTRGGRFTPGILIRAGTQMLRLCFYRPGTTVRMYFFVFFVCLP